MFLTSKGEKIYIFFKVAKMWSSLRKDKKKVFYFSGNRGGGAVSPKAKFLNFFVFFFEGFPNSTYAWKRNLNKKHINIKLVSSLKRN